MGKWKNENSQYGVGYEGQNLSHFTSSDYWATGSTKRAMWFHLDGLAGITMKNTLTTTNPPEKPVAVQIGSNA